MKLRDFLKENILVTDGAFGIMLKNSSIILFANVQIYYFLKELQAFIMIIFKPEQNYFARIHLLQINIIRN